MAKQLANVLGKIFLVSIPFILASLCMVFFPYWTYDHEYPIFQQRKDYIFAQSDTVHDVLFLGDSGVQASVRPDLLDATGASTYNLALPGAISIQTYYMLKHYLESGKRARTAYISFVPLHFWQMSDYWDRSAYFHFLPLKDMIEVGRTAYELEDEAFNDYLPKLISYELYFVNRYSSALRRFGRKRRRSNIERYEKLSADRGHHLFGTAEKTETIGLVSTFRGMPEPNPTIELYYNRLIQLCLDNGIEVILEQTPLNLYERPHMDEKFLSDYTRFMEKYRDRYPQARVNTEPYFFPSSCFGDPLHVNIPGSERYTKMIMEKYPDIFVPGGRSATQ